MKKFKAKADGYYYKKGDILKLIQKETDGFSFYYTEKGDEVCVHDENLEELKDGSRIPVETKVQITTGDESGHSFARGAIGTIKGYKPLFEGTADFFYIVQVGSLRQLLNREDFEVYQPKFTKGEHVRVIGNTTANCKHFVKIGTTGVVDYCKYSEKYHNEMALVSCGDGLQQHIGTQDLELIPKEQPCIPKKQPKFSKGDTVRITKRLNGHAFKIGEIVKVEKVMPLNYFVTNNVSTWCVTDEEIEKVILDKQGYPLTIGDKVMICTLDVTPMQGRIGNIKTISDVKVKIDFETGFGLTMAPMELLKLSKNGLPYQVDISFYADHPRSILGILKKQKGILNTTFATCSTTDEFSWETGVYGVLIPRLFNCPIRLGV